MKKEETEGKGRKLIEKFQPAPDPREENRQKMRQNKNRNWNRIIDRADAETKYKGKKVRGIGEEDGTVRVMEEEKSSLKGRISVLG